MWLNGIAHNQRLTEHLSSLLADGRLVHAYLFTGQHGPALEIAEAVEALRARGACCAQMSGSGSAVYGVFPDERTADAALPAIRARWGSACRCATCAESMTFAEE